MKYAEAINAEAMPRRIKGRRTAVIVSAI
ncbi:hypothetical protein CP8484711_0671A, partial [Chlamydia psittaci 84-8471/1]